MKEQSYNIIKTKNKTQELNVKAISRNPRPCYDCEHGSLESIKNQDLGEIVSLKILSQTRKLVSRPRKYSELTPADAIQADCDVEATNIILQGLPPEVYAVVSNHRIAKELWERI
ncbi:hypothetical protein Tco_0507889 [Tanacetum coccineum]